MFTITLTKVCPSQSFPSVLEAYGAKRNLWFPVLSGMEVFSSIAEGLTSYLFNYLSVETNDSMRALTVVSVVFIPFTAISSYFGMNFDEFAALKNQVSYYWAVTTPVVVVTILIFCSDYLVRFLKHVQRVAFHSDFRVRSAPLPSQP